MLDLYRTLSLIDEARALWPFEIDPGLGVHPFDKFKLLVTSHEIKKGKKSTRYVLLLEEETLSMSYNWESFFQNMTTPREYDLPSPGPKERNQMAPSGMYDEETREKIRLKCKNDWDLELTEDQISMCIIEMEETGLSIFHNQLWPNSRKYKKQVTDDRGNTRRVDAVRITWDKTIDGYRAVAAATGLLGGLDAPAFSFESKGADEEPDLVARVTVYRLGPGGRRHPFVGEARYGEFVQMVTEWANGRKTGKKIPNHVWSESPKNQLAVAAERQALRKAFQSCDDDQTVAIPVAEAAPDREPALEESRGQAIPAEDAPSSPGPAPAPEPEPEPEPEKPKGTYVGIPSAGFVLFAKYNKEERIIALGKKEGRTILALDSGKRVTVNDEGFEIDRRDRKDEKKGGRDWKPGDEYFHHEKVVKVAGSKKDEWALRLLLDSGFQVRLNRWGREEHRKKRDQAPPAAEEPPANVEHDPRTGGDVVDTTAAPTPDPNPPAEAHAPGDNENVDVESITDVATLRMHCIPLLKRYCEVVLKRRVSPKEAYGELTGVVLQKGQQMGLDDYRVLYECLGESLEEVSANERKAG